MLFVSLYCNQKHNVMKILNPIAILLILSSIFNITLFRILPLGFIELVIMLLIGIAMLGLNMRYLDKQDKIKKGKWL
jgi:uncharacterized membrane protein